METDSAWQTDHVFHQGDLFFDEMIRLFASAKESIEVETYIFAAGELAERMILALEEAVKRGVHVRVLVDGIGSSGWRRTFGDRFKQSGIKFKIYHELPWDRFWIKGATRRRQSLARWFSRLNNRDHRKVFIIDKCEAFVGSYNVCDDHLASVRGEKAWRDTGVFLQGQEIKVLLNAFNTAWLSRFKRLKPMLWRRRKLLEKNQLVRLNATRRERKNNYEDLLNRITRAKNRVWIVSAYFVPDSELVKALSYSAKNGIDVRIVLPYQSDVFFIPWVSSAFHYGLLKAGVKIFEYLPSMLHAKTILIDDWALVGSSNLNHRSLLHDLEADVVLTSEEARASLEKAYLENIEASQLITLNNWSNRPFLERWIGKLLLNFRYLL